MSREPWTGARHFTGFYKSTPADFNLGKDISMTLRHRIFSIALLALITVLGSLMAACMDEPYDDDQRVRQSDDEADLMDDKTELGEDETELIDDETELVQKAVDVVRQMKTDTGLKQLLGQSQGVLIVPDYGKAALGAGVRGGSGVLLVRTDGAWSSPAFFDIGAVSAGLEAGAEFGSIALVLNSRQAVDEFLQDNNWSLNAEAGLTVINWSGKVQASAGKDAVMWSDTEGLFASAAVSVSDISFDEEDTAEFYGREQISVRDVVYGDFANPQAQELTSVLGDPGPNRLSDSDRYGEARQDRYADTDPYKEDRDDRYADAEQTGQERIADTEPYSLDRNAGADALPQTASPLALVLLLGLGSLASAVGLRATRK